MGRRSYRASRKFYCPACKKKTLVRSRAYDNNAGRSFYSWECENQLSRRQRRILDGDEYFYDDEERAAAEEKVKKHLAKNPECDCVITAPGRDAEIADYGTVLDKLIRIGEPIKHHLLETDKGIYRKGMQVLYSSDHVDVVRLRDQSGVAVWLYWKVMWEPNRSQSEINWAALCSEAAAYLFHENTTLRTIFRNTKRFPVWTKEEGGARDYSLREAPLSGSLGKKKKAEIVEWVKKLETNLPTYEAQAKAANDKWVAWGRQLQEKTADSKVRVVSFNSMSKTAAITIRGTLSQEQIEAVVAALAGTPAAVQ
jgi:hypothetical protein